MAALNPPLAPVATLPIRYIPESRSQTGSPQNQPDRRAVQTPRGWKRARFLDSVPQQLEIQKPTQNQQGCLPKSKYELGRSQRVQKQIQPIALFPGPRRAC